LLVCCSFLSRAMRCLLQSVSIVVASANLPAFREWQEEYGRVYATVEEEDMRFEQFTRSVATIAETARANPMATFGLDDFADWTAEELRAHRPLNGAPVWPDAEEQAAFSQEAVSAARAAGSIDWVERGAVLPATSQGRCGTCAQFSATANIEAQWFLAGHPLQKLSEQEMIDCSSYTGPYGMGWVSDIHKGLDKIEDYALADHSDPNITGCRSPCDEAKANKSFAHIDGATCLSGMYSPASQLLAWLQHGPLSISVDAGPFNGYKGGIITANSTCSSWNTDHAVLIVGYGVENGTEYWKLKNSWGPAFGENGYVRVLYNAFGENSTRGCLGLLGSCQAYIGSPPGGSKVIV